MESESAAIGAQREISYQRYATLLQRSGCLELRPKLRQHYFPTFRAAPLSNSAGGRHSEPGSTGTDRKVDAC
jgi:hypothetical protein